MEVEIRKEVDSPATHNGDSPLQHREEEQAGGMKEMQAFPQLLVFQLSSTSQHNSSVPSQEQMEEVEVVGFF